MIKHDITEVDPMLSHITLYYFSPTGGTKKTADIVCHALAEQVTAIDLGDRTLPTPPQPDTDLIVAAAPVFAGRIPAFLADKLSALQGSGKCAVTLAVYGNRDYDDALLELNDTLTACGFAVIGSGAVIAQHSQLPELAAGRPDAADRENLAAFAESVLAKLAKGDTTPVTVPGSRPYKKRSPNAVAPDSTEACSRCGLCQRLCPTGAIHMTDRVETDVSRCILCRACTAHCPTGARVVSDPFTQMLRQKLSPCIPVRRENWYCL